MDGFTPMIRAIIIDDEDGSREMLSMLLQQHCPEVRIVAMADSAESGQAEIERWRPNLVFLDIQMPFASGFDMLNAIQPRTFEVIFTTAYDQYALRAVKYSALDYLLKPIDRAELQEAVQRAAQRLRLPGGIANPVVQAQLEILLSTLSLESVPERVALPTHDGIEFVAVKSIVRCEASINYTYFYFTNRERLLITRTLKEFEHLLFEHNFLRVHNTHLINIRHVSKYMRNSGGQVVMVDGSVVDVSRRRRDELLEKLSHHIFPK